MGNIKFKIDFIGLGAPKSGSSWMGTILAQHPQIEFSYKKEVDYFNKKSIRGNINTRYNLGLEFYRKFWSKKIDPNKKIGEFSTNYLFDDSAPKLIKETFPDAKLIAILRNPIDRTFTDYFARVNSSSLPQLTFEDAIEKYEWLIEGSKYAKQVKRYFELFPKEQIKIFLLDEVKENSLKVCKELYSFVGVDPDFQPDTNPVHTASKAKSVGLLKLQKKLFLKLPRKILLGKLMPKKISKLLLNSSLTRAYEKITGKIMHLNFKKVKKEKINPEIKKKLLKIFLKDIEELEKLINKDLSAWKK